MKSLFFFTLLTIFSSVAFAQSQTIPNDQIEFVNEFVDAVESHNSKKVLKLLDKTYRKEQLGFLNGNKDQLVNELFGGVDQTTDEYTYVNTVFSDILKIEVAEIIPLKEGGFNYIFRIRDSEHDILKSLLLVVKPKFGFVGSRG